jgi:hypothetical protein
VFANPTLRKARTKGVPQEVESLVGIGSSAILILAVHDARFVWMDFQATLRQPSRDSVQNEVGSPLALAVNNQIIAIPLKLQIGKLLPHPHVERVVQEEVG